jgi:hypothetical protein
MPKWIFEAWDWLVFHREGIFGGTVVAFIAFLLGAMKWWYEVKKLRREEKALKLESRKAQVLNFLRQQTAYQGLNGQTMEQIAIGLRLRNKEVKFLLHSLANDSPVRVHLLGGRWFLGPFPVEVFKQPW